MDRTDLDPLPPLIDVPTAAAVLGIGRTLAYDLVRTDRFPTPVLRIGKLIRIPTAGLRRLLDAVAPALSSGRDTACSVARASPVDTGRRWRHRRSTLTGDPAVHAVHSQHGV